jgi:DNA-binding NtrC family response regulator
MKNLILIVDDEPTILDSGKLILEDEGFEVITASDGREAMNIIKKKTIEVVLTDFKMPGLNGLELIKWIKEFKPELPVFMITSYVNRSIKGVVTQAGACVFMLKPIDYTELIEKIEEITGNQ